MSDEPATRIVGVITAGVMVSAAVVEGGVARFEGHGEGGVHVDTGNLQCAANFRTGARIFVNGYLC